MIDWNARIDDLMAVLERDWNIADRQTVEILLAAMIDLPRIPAPWIILETPWTDWNSEYGWFSFGNLWPTYSLDKLRRRRANSETQQMIADWLDDRKTARLFVEPEWNVYWKWTRMKTFDFLVQRSLRLRTALPKTDLALRTLDSQDGLNLAAEIAFYARKILHDPSNARHPAPPKLRHVPDNFLFHIELVQKMSPWFPQFNLLATGLGSIAVRRAYLFGRTETDASDFETIARLAADTVPVWTTMAFERLCCGPAHQDELLKIITPYRKDKLKTGTTNQYLTELLRLQHEGLFYRRKDVKTWPWTLRPEHATAMRDIIDGLAFKSPKTLDKTGT